ncbi:MAG: DUF3048 domain-containing protein [Candidatus Daviesbacteria bacterium]|nr:DUF3048 domain-containing protein [Candidatus Daviesbacteria bacterium]
MDNIKANFSKLTEVQKVLVIIIAAILLYGVSTGVTYTIFGGLKQGGAGINLTSGALPGPTGAVEEDANEPKTETCPLNGALKSKTARNAWEARRPLAVMIENHIEARPQSGLTSADVVYEAVAEGGITRFMALYYCNLSDVQVGPVRSARTYYLDWLGEYNNPLYAHVGGANTPGPADALSQIIKYKVNDLNQFSIGFPTYWRDYERLGHPVATEHTMYSTTQKLWAVGAQRGWVATDSAGISWSKGFTPWKFKDDEKISSSSKSGGTIKTITVNFWASQGDYTVEWDYNAATNTYDRKNGTAHIDFNNKKQISPKSVVIQFEKESNANDGYPGNVHLLYGTTGTGKALIIMDGNVVEGKWIKADRLSRSKYVDSKGKEIIFDKGQIWIETVPEGSKVTY